MEAREEKTLTSEVLNSDPLSSLHRTVVSVVLDAIRCAPGRVAATLIVEPTGDRDVSIKPEREGCAPMSLILYADERRGIGVVMGEHARLNVPDDVYPRPMEGTLEVVEAIIRAVIEGQLTETLYRVCDTGLVYRCSFKLDTAVGLIELDRTHVPTRLRNLLRRTESSELTYRKY